MKKYFSSLLLFCLFLSPACMQGQALGTVTIKGTLKNFTNEVLVEDLSEMQYLLPPSRERIIVPDSLGNFDITFKIGSPNYFRIGRNVLYLTPGDDLTVYIDKMDPRKSEFKGRGSSANRYLKNTPFPKGGSYIEAGRNAKPTAGATLALFEEMARKKQEELKGVGNVSQEFRRLEEARIRADVINSVKSGLVSFYLPKVSADSLAAYKEDYAKLMQPVIDRYSHHFIDPSLLKLVVYRDIAGELIRKFPSQKGVRQIKDWIKAGSLVGAMERTNDKVQLAAFGKRIDSVGTPTFRNALTQYLKNLLRFGKGDEAADFTAVDTDGHAVKLSSLKGKLIYVDLWATWCGPCMAEMPHFEALKEKYKDDPRIAFVSLSIDDGIELWKRNLRQRNAKGIQWLINRNKLDAYHIVEIPRTLLIDRNFRMADMNAPVPSSKKTVPMIDSELKK